MVAPMFYDPFGKRGGQGNLHSTAQQLYLEGHDSFANPHNREDATEHNVSLLGASIEAEQEAQQQAEDQRTP